MLMKTAVTILACILYLLCAGVDLWSLRRGRRIANRIFKPLLMPLLLMIYILSAKAFSWKVAAALFFGFLGDSFLLGSGIFYAFGLLSFLTGHIFYTLSFLERTDLHAVPAVIWPVLLIGYLTVCILVCRQLFPYVHGKAKPAVSFYIAALLCMSASSCLCAVTAGEFFPAFAGSVLFVISDSMIAFRYFKKRHGALSDVAIMATYIAAQTLIIYSFAG